MASGGDFDPYGELGLERGCGQDEVRRAYRRRVSACHPDKGGDREEFERVQRAYDVLGDPEKRRAHDAGETYFDDSDARLEHDAVANLVQSVVELTCHLEDTSNVFLKLVEVGHAAERNLTRDLGVVAGVRRRLEAALEAVRTPRGPDEPDPVRDGLRAKLREVSLAERQANWNLKVSRETLRLAQLYSMDPSKFFRASLLGHVRPTVVFEGGFFQWGETT